MKFNIKYGIKSILRTPLKTILFFLLLAAATAFLSLGIGILRSAEDMLAEADSVFKTAGEFIYTGGNYPGNSQYDPYLDIAAAGFLNTDALARPEVLMAEESMMHRAVAGSYKQDRNIMPYGHYAVLLVTARVYESMYDWGDGRLSHVWEAPYSTRDVVDTLVVLKPQDDNPDEYTNRHQYAVFGTFSDMMQSNYKAFQAAPFESIGIENAPYPPVVEIYDDSSSGAFWASDEGAFFSNVVDLLDSANRSVSLVVTKDITAISQFHTGEFVITEGGYFSQEDTKSCLIPLRIAAQLNLAVGDTLSLSIQYPTGETGLYNGYDVTMGFASEETFTVAGIYQSEENEETIYIPYSDQPWAGRSKADYCLARVVLDNRGAASYIESVTPLLPPGVVFNYADQGYAGAVRPILAMREAALTITAVCAGVFLFLLWFFGFFFIFRSRESARVLSTLGTRAGGILSHFLAGSGLIALVSASAGGLIGYLASGSIAGSVFNAFTGSRDIRFSIESYGIRFADFEVTAETSPGPFILTAATVFAAAVVVSAIFAAFRISSQNPSRMFRKRQKRAQKTHDNSRDVMPESLRKGIRPGSSDIMPESPREKTIRDSRDSHDSRGSRPRRAAATRIALPTASLRYAVRSTLRSGKRGLAVPCLFAVLLSFLSVFTGLRESYRDSLDHVYDDVPVTAHFTDRRGSRYDNLLIDVSQFDEIEEMGYSGEMWRSANFLIRFDYISDPVDWDDPDSAFWERPYIPMGDFTYDTFVGQLRNFSTKLTMTNDFARSPEFMFAPVPDVTFAEGFGWDSFYSQFTDWGAPDCLIASSQFLADYNLALGDTAVFSIFSSDLVVAVQHPFVIGGVFESSTGRGSVYIPENEDLVTIYYTTMDTITTATGRREIVYNTTTSVRYHAGGFLLSNTNDLSNLKDSLMGQYEQLGTLGGQRRWIVIDDKALYDTIDALNRHIAYMDIASPVIFALVVLIGFIVSNLLLKSRSTEIGLLRGVGTAQAAIFASLFVEQVLLSIPGFLVGVFAPSLAELGAYDIGGAGVFVLCYFAGAAAAILHTQRSKAIKNVGRREE